MIEHRTSHAPVTAVSAQRGSTSTSDHSIAGHAALYRVETTIGGEFREQIAHGAFDSALRRRDDVRCLLNHDVSALLGRASSGTLALSTDYKGLFYRVSLPST